MSRTSPGGHHDLVAHISRDAGTWYAYVPGLDGALASARSLEAVTEQVTRRVVALLGAPPEDITIRWEYDLPALERMVVDEVQLYQAELADAQMNYNAALRRAVTHLRELSYSDRDAAVLLRLSHQRIAQVRAQVAGEEKS
jgi:hypothetical protein